MWVIHWYCAALGIFSPLVHCYVLVWLSNGRIYDLTAANCSCFNLIHGPCKHFTKTEPEMSGNQLLHVSTLRWRHNGCDSVSNHQPHDCLLNRLFRHRSKKTSKLRVTGLCAGNSTRTGEFPAQMVSNTENVSIWWRHHGNVHTISTLLCFVVVE